jgi:hypothetical protein
MRDRILEVFDCMTESVLGVNAVCAELVLQGPSWITEDDKVVEEATLESRKRRRLARRGVATGIS